MCISMRFCARAGWTPSLACANCPLAKAIRVRQARQRAADATVKSSGAGIIAQFRQLFAAQGIQRPH